MIVVNHGNDIHSPVLFTASTARPVKARHATLSADEVSRASTRLQLTAGDGAKRCIAVVLQHLAELCNCGTTQCQRRGAVCVNQTEEFCKCPSLGKEGLFFHPHPQDFMTQFFLDVLHSRQPMRTKKCPSMMRTGQQNFTRSIAKAKPSRSAPGSL
ncbi:small integral membrane protein 13 isoform X1 [Stigmatopora argus]